MTEIHQNKPFIFQNKPIILCFFFKNCPFYPLFGPRDPKNHHKVEDFTLFPSGIIVSSKFDYVWKKIMGLFWKIKVFLENNGFILVCFRHFSNFVPNPMKILKGGPPPHRNGSQNRPPGDKGPLFPKPLKPHPGGI